MKTKLLLVLAVLLLSGLVFFVFPGARISIAPGEYYEKMALPILDYDLFDVGVVDVNGDGFLDVYTANHSARQSLLVNKGDGQFADALSTLGLDQDHEFPGLEDTLELPDFAAPGLYIYRQDRWLHVEAHSVDADNPARGTISVPWPIVIGKAPGTTEVEEMTTASGSVHTTIRFALQGNQSLVFNGAEDIVEVPHRMTLEPAFSLNDVFVGRPLTHPSGHAFELLWRDRHGMAWADFDSDGDMDLFIARGGIKGQLDRFAEPVLDELLARGYGVFAEQTTAAGLQKGNCPARQVAWVDFDGDGDLDLYVSCGRDEDPSFPNRLYQQDDERQFVDVAAAFGLDYPTASVFAWLDADGDNDLDLLSAEDGKLLHYRNDGGVFVRQSINPDTTDSRPYKFAVADFDNDGDPDAFAVQGRQSLLIINTDGRFSLQVPETVGLPAAGRTANWVDFDNDGLLDLHVVPGGLYRQQSDRRFAKSGILAYDGQVNEIVDARSTWFDVDNDGYRDVVISALTGPTLLQRFQRKFAGKAPDLGDHWQTSAFSAVGPKEHHWLQIDLQGPMKNRQAIGARAYVSASGSTQSQSVGTAEGAHFGQGHYRLYFGLGSSTVADEVRIVWPDGHTRDIRDVPADQLMQITYDGRP